MRGLVCVFLVCAACAGVPRTGGASSAERGAVWAALELDERGVDRAALDAWRAVLTGTRDRSIALLALERIDALVADGFAGEALQASLAGLELAQADPEVQRALALVHARIARMRGDEPRARRDERAAGCGQPWQLGAALGRLPHLDLARPITDATFRAARAARVKGCHVLALSSDGRSAAIPIGLEVTLPSAGDVELLVGTDQAHVVRIDGGVSDVPDAHAPIRRRRRYRVHLEAGAHRIVVVVAATFGRVDAELALRTFPEARIAAIGAGSAIPRVAIEEQRLVAPPIEDAHLRAFLRTADALREGDAVESREAAAALISSAARQTGVRLAASLALAGRVAREDPTVPARVARDRARRSFERALEADPRSARVRADSVRLALERDRARDALALVDAAPDRAVVRLALLRVDVLRARGREAEIRPVLEAAAKVAPGACAIEEALQSDDRHRHRPLSIGRARRVARCRPGSTVYGDALRQSGDLAGAIAEYRAVVEADPIGESPRAALGETLAASGDHAGAVDVYRALVEGAPRSATYRLRLVDALVAAGRGEDARRTLADGVAADPESAELATATRSLGDTTKAEPYDPDRLVGREVIAAFEASGRHYDGPAVFILDRTVARVYATGGQRTITHNIVKVLAKDGIDRWGEWRIPQGAELLGLWAWKPDGARIEPEELSEKETISIPKLAVGDYVEVEYVERAPPPGAFDRGFLAERFYFGSLDAPLDRSEYVLVTPPEIPVELELRGKVPAVAVTSRQERAGVVTVRTFAARSVPQEVAEPSAAPLAEFMPSVRASARVSLSAWRAYLTDLSFATRRRDPAIDALAKQIVAGARSDAERVMKLDAWVRLHVKQGGGIEDFATVVLARREGNRVVLLAALADAVGLPARVLLAKSLRATAIASELEGYDQPLIEVAGMVIDPRQRHGRPGDLPSHLRGASALVLEPGASDLPIVLPTRSNDHRSMDVKIELDDSGAGTVRVEERLTGWPAVEWRESLERLPADRVRPQFEQHTLGYFFPGATLDTLTWEAADRDDVPFVVRYTLHAPGLARRAGSALVMPAPFAAHLLRRYETGAPRHSPLFVDEVAPTDLTLEVKLPRGARAVAAPPIDRTEAHGRFAQHVEVAGEVMRMRSSFFVPTARIGLTAWPAFLDWAAAVDRAEAAIVRISK